MSVRDRAESDAEPGGTRDAVMYERGDRPADLLPMTDSRNLLFQVVLRTCHEYYSDISGIPTKEIVVHRDAASGVRRWNS